MADPDRLSAATQTDLPGAPDRSCISDPVVARALDELLSDERMQNRWSGLSARARRVHRDILTTWLHIGAAPDAVGYDPDILRDLARRDLIRLRHRRIALAYPFSAIRTDYAVRIGDVRAHAVCAIDALGVAAMARKATRLRCPCPVCADPITVALRADGLSVSLASPVHIRVWASVTPIAACAADSQCQTMKMFCSPDHLSQWRAEQENPRGFDMSLAQGVELGAAIFRPFLASPPRWKEK